MKTIYQELKVIFEQLNYKIVLDKGSFNSGYCILEDEKIIVINKNKPYENRIKILSEILSSIVTKDIYIKPIIRDMISQ